MKTIILLSILLLNGCSYYIGVGIHTEGLDRPDVDLDNPIFVGGGKYSYKEYDIFLEHHSGIFDTEAGSGYNLLGIKYNFNKL